jgi:glycerol uptake facilitator protein
MMSPFVSEFVGTAILLLIGNGVVANVVLQKTKGNNSGWIVITTGWAMAVFVAVFISGSASGAHLNPAVTIALAVQTNQWSTVPLFISAQLLGAMVGTFLVWLVYKPHFDCTDDADGKLAVFCTAPSIKSLLYNFLGEFIATFAFMLAILFLTKSAVNLGSIDALPVAFIVFAIGLGLGGNTGYAINPARDLGPRIVHFLLPITNKSNSDWQYSWIPVVAPIAGAIGAVLLYKVIV